MEISLADKKKLVVRIAKKLRQSVVKLLYSLERFEDESLLLYHGKIYVPNIMNLHRRMVTLHYNLKVAGHPGRWKTLQLVSQNYWQPQMSRYMSQYISTCNFCLYTKLVCYLPLGQLYLLPLLNARWNPQILTQ